MFPSIDTTFLDTFATCLLAAIFITELQNHLLINIHITLILASLRRTSEPIQLTIVSGVLGTQETSCILIAGLLEREYVQPLPPVDSINLGLLT